MPHLRDRKIKTVFLKNTKFWPVIALFGPRQCGKSTFLREIAFDGNPCTYRTFDQSAQRRLAQQNPEAYLKSFETYPVVLDEAQKVPDVFDEIKALVDLKRVPGRYVLSGSVEFSKKTGIRESLTGRCATLRMDSFTLEEANPGTSYSLKDVLVHLENGGMPGVFAIRNKDLRTSYWDEWLETLCERDMKSLSQARLSGDLALAILETIGLLEMTTALEISKKLKIDTRKVQSHIAALMSLFVLREVAPHEDSVGKSTYHFFDCGLASHFKASAAKKWQAFFLHEQLNRASFVGKKIKMFKYYRSKRGSFIDFMDSNGNFHAFCESVAPSKREHMTFRAALKIHPKSKVYVYCPTDAPLEKIGQGIYRVPWGRSAKEQR